MRNLIAPMNWLPPFLGFMVDLDLKPNLDEQSHVIILPLWASTLGLTLRLVENPALNPKLRNSNGFIYLKFTLLPPHNVRHVVWSILDLSVHDIIYNNKFCHFHHPYILIQIFFLLQKEQMF